MTDNSTSTPTVGDDEIGSSEDRSGGSSARPVASTIPPWGRAAVGCSVPAPFPAAAYIPPRIALTGATPRARLPGDGAIAGLASTTGTIAHE